MYCKGACIVSACIDRVCIDRVCVLHLHQARPCSYWKHTTEDDGDSPCVQTTLFCPL